MSKPAIAPSQGVGSDRIKRRMPGCE